MKKRKAAIFLFFTAGNVLMRLSGSIIHDRRSGEAEKATRPVGGEEERGETQRAPGLAGGPGGRKMAGGGLRVGAPRTDGKSVRGAQRAGMRRAGARSRGAWAPVRCAREGQKARARERIRIAVGVREAFPRYVNARGRASRW